MSLGTVPGGATVRVKNTARGARLCGPWALHSDVWTTVPIEFVAQYGYDKALVFDFSSLAEYMERETPDGRMVVDFWSPLSSVDGYGRHAIDIWKGIRNLGYEARLRNNGYFVDLNHLPNEILREARESDSKLPSRVSIAMTVPYDPMLWSSQSVYKIGITQFETDHVPERHVDAVNRCDHLIVTSSFQPDIWRKGGVNIPISVLTPGVDTDFLAEINRPMDGTFKVLILGALTGRKNPLGAIRIFLDASQGNPDWRLTIKTRPTPVGFKEVETFVRDLRDPRISIITEEVSSQGLLWFYHHHDCLLWPTKGEGVGLPPMEAMATGMEVVSCDHSGLGDFVDSGWAWPIKTKGKEPANLPNSGFGPDYIQAYGSVGNWWLPDESHAAKQLRACFNAWREGKGKGHKAATYVRAAHTLGHQALSVMKVAELYK